MDFTTKVMKVRIDFKGNGRKEIGDVDDRGRKRGSLESVLFIFGCIGY